eukprot:scaffold397_cov403-Prasinococcus_capsulatus_cf.AAC.2
MGGCVERRRAATRWPGARTQRGGRAPRSQRSAPRLGGWRRGSGPVSAADAARQRSRSGCETPAQVRPGVLCSARPHAPRLPVPKIERPHADPAWAPLRARKPGRSAPSRPSFTRRPDATNCAALRTRGRLGGRIERGPDVG